MKNRVGILLLLAALLPVHSFAYDGRYKGQYECNCDWWIMGGGGGDVPTPLGMINQRVELADGERYSLIGWIRVDGNQLFFEADLDQQPWLARKKSPEGTYYPLFTKDRIKLKNYADLRVRLIAEANGFVKKISRKEMQFTYQIWLYPLLEPTQVDMY
ncbi:MAG: hypothetical protein A2583_10015 [Bdellovibrionales bacterium RIFOXYD1_FULL_53_11]|nr:MAG: hypothetical protein A2583_10015 [Bdellovibrionales bacterium RIFOXYD1_FULL_53_11]